MPDLEGELVRSPKDYRGYIVVLARSLSLISLHSQVTDCLMCLHFTSLKLGALTMATFKGLLKINENSISKRLLGPWKEYSLSVYG